MRGPGGRRRWTRTTTSTPPSPTAPAARRRTWPPRRQPGCARICLAEHVRAGTGWLPEFVAAVAALEAPAGLTVRTGVEAKILDMTGRLDLPADLSGVDLVLIADHQFPSDVGPVDPAVLRQDLADGAVSPADVLECLAEATANAASTVPAAIIAHPFSVLPKIGLSEDDVPDALLTWLARRLLAAGTAAEVNEKWSCPAPRTVAALAGAGVPLVASTDSHHSSAVGRYESVRGTSTRSSPAGPPGRTGRADGPGRAQVAAGVPRAGRGRSAGRGQLSVPAGRAALPATALQPVRAVLPAHGDPHPGLERGPGHRDVRRPAHAAEVPGRTGCGSTSSTTPAPTRRPGCCARKERQYPGRVFHLRREVGGQGKAHTLNHGLEQVLADDWMQAVLIMDSDVIYEPDSLRLMTRHLADPEVGSVNAYIKEGSRPGNYMTKFIGYEYITAQAAARRSQNVLGAVALPGRRRPAALAGQHRGGRRPDRHGHAGRGHRDHVPDPADRGEGDLRAARGRLGRGARHHHRPVEAAAPLGARQHPGHPAVLLAVVPASAAAPRNRPPARQHQLRAVLVLAAAPARLHDRPRRRRWSRCSSSTSRWPGQPSTRCGSPTC